VSDCCYLGKEVNPAFQSNSFEPIAIGLGFGVCPKGPIGIPMGDAHGRIYFELWILNRYPIAIGYRFWIFLISTESPI